MEVCAKLESFLDENEINDIPEIAKSKILDHLTNLNQTIADLQSEKSELHAVLERQQFEFEKEVSSSHQQLEESVESCTKLKLQIAELEESLNSVQKQWRDLQTLHDSSMLEFQTVKRENELLTQEKKNLVEQLEKRRADIEKLNGEIKSLLDQSTSANEAKFEAIAAAEEAKMKESNLQHQVTRLEQEKELLTRQIADLNAEVAQKNSEIHTLKREKSNNLLDLKSQLENRADEVHLLQKRLDCFKENLEEKDNRIEALAEKIRQLNQAHSKSEVQFNLELNAQSKLIELHKKASEDNQQRVQELMRAFEEAQKLLRENSASCEEMEKQCLEMEQKHLAVLEEKQREIIALREELVKAKDLSNSFSKETIEKMFPVAAATSKVIHSGMTLTELYVEYTRLQEELQKQKDANSNLTQQLKQIVAEIEEKTPLINQRMVEYEKSKETISSLKSQLSCALVDYEKVLQERNDCKRICNLAERENSRLKTQVLDLNRQVQVLLKEVEEARGGSICQNRSQLHEDALVTSSDDITADKIISRHLVTFRDIEEIQLKNQKLLAVIRDLSQQHEEMEKKLSSELNAKFQKDIETLTAQLEDLQQKRNKQSEMLETIIRQRDMYRVLLTSQGMNESILGQPDGSFASNIGSKFSPGEPRLKEAKTALNQLQAEFDNYKKEKNENERILNEQMDKMRNDLSDLRIQNAKLASQCEYSEERVKMLQTNLETYKKEYVSYKDKNQQHTGMIVQHQQTINDLRQDLMIAHEKMAKSEVMIENLKAERDLLKSVEARLLQEKESSMKEHQHQNKLMANLQAVQNNLERIESESKRNLEYQVEKLEKENAILKAKVDNCNEEYRSAVKIWEKQNKELQAKVDVEVARSRKAHEDLVDAYSQMHELKQQLTACKSSAPSTPEKYPTAVSKTPQKPSESVATAGEVKQLKEQLTEAQMKLKSMQEKLDIASKSAEQYLSMCKDLELRVKEQDEINKQLQETMDSALSSSKEVQSSLEKNLVDLERTNRELLEENSKLNQNSGSQVHELQQKVCELLKSLEDYKNQAATAKETADQARADCQNQMKLMQDIQEKYERELMLHAQDMQAMTALKEEHHKCSAKIESLTEKASVAEQVLAESKESWERQKEILKSEAEALKQRMKDLELCNKNLHEQLDLMGTQMAALQSKNWDETPYASIQSDLKDTQHLLQVIQFIKKEKEIVSTQFDVVQSENVRLNIKLEQLTNELNETKAELKDVLSNFQAKAASDAQHAELLKKVEMLNLLSESNNLLRMEKESLSASKSRLEVQLQEMESKLQPLLEKERELSQQNDVLAAENNALRMEVKGWQSRTNQLLEQSHKIGPQEYKNLTKERDELKSQKERIAEELQKKQAECSQLNASTTSLKKELENSKKTLTQKSLENTELNEKVNELQKVVLQVKKIGRKYKTQFDELKMKHDELESKLKALESMRQEQTVDEMQKKLEESEKNLKDMKAEFEKAADQAKLAQAKSLEKEDRALKILSQLRVKYSQINNQKETIAEENKKLTKEVQDLKSQISALMLSQEENTQNRTNSDATIARLEKELKMEKDSRVSEREFLEKKYDDLCQKMNQKQKMMTIGIAERASGSGTEPLTANIKPLTAPSTSGVAPGIRHSPHPGASGSRPTPTASIRPMAIGTASPSTPPQARMATVLPTTAAHPHAEEAAAVPHPVQPIVQASAASPATATVAPTSIAITVSDAPASEISELPGEQHQTETPHAHVIGIQVAPSPMTALVAPRVDVGEPAVEPVQADSPAPTTSVIVSPPVTQIVTPTVKRPRDENSTGSDMQESALKRVKMVSEGSQTNQQHQASAAAATPSNVAVVSAAPVIPRTKPQEVVQPSVEVQPPSVGVIPEADEAPVAVIASTEPSSSADESVVPTAGPSETEIFEDEKDDQNIEWDAPLDDAKIEEDFEADVMDDETVIIEETEELEEDVEQMQDIDTKSPDDEDMTEEPPEEEMVEQSQPVPADIDVLEPTSDIQMEADNGSAPIEPVACMAPPAFPPAPEVAPAIDAVIATTPSVQQAPPPIAPPRIDRQPPVSRQHLTPFNLPGQGSNFEEGDDSIVPSTPTLYVPRRTDGFAEAVSSPHVPQGRFLFSSSDGSPTQQSYTQSQLASQGALGVDDTRMDLFDEGSSRTVPSTPLQVSPPVPSIFSSDAAAPEVPSSGLDSAPLSEVSAGIEIRIDLVQEVSESSDPVVASNENIESTASKPAENLAPENTEKIVTSHTEGVSASPSLAAEPSPSEDAAKSEESTKVEEQADSAATSKDETVPPAPQRKPIVWNQDKTEATPSSTPDPSVAPTQTATTTTTRARARARGSRYAASAAYSRGRGNTTWTLPTRGRPRGVTRRRMY